MTTEGTEADRGLRDRMLEMSRGYVLARAIHVAAELGIANHVTDEPLTASELSTLTGSYAPYLERLLRFLAGHGVFAEVAPGAFVATPLSELLSDGSPHSMRGGLCMVNAAWWAAVGDLGHSVRTGETAFFHCHGQPFFSHLKESPADQQSFDAGMANNSRSSDQAIAAAYDFSSASVVMDLGGGRGGLIRAILERHTGVQGRLFEQPQVLELSAAGLAAQPALAGRLTGVPGNFFESIPQGADVYLLKGVLHDFDDQRCLQILGNCRRALGADGKLLIIERLVSPDNRPHQAKTIDILMMALLGGRERAPAEWSELLGAARFELRRQLATGSEFSITEAFPV